MTRGPFANTPVTLTTLQVNKSLWDAPQPRQVTIAQLGGKGVRVAGDEFLVTGKQYLLFIRPDDLEPNTGYFNIAGGVSYVLSGPDYQLMGEKVEDDPVDNIPSAMPAGKAESQVTGSVATSSSTPAATGSPKTAP